MFSVRPRELASSMSTPEFNTLLALASSTGNWIQNSKDCQAQPFRGVHGSVTPERTGSEASTMCQLRATPPALAMSDHLLKVALSSWLAAGHHCKSIGKSVSALEVVFGCRPLQQGFYDTPHVYPGPLHAHAAVSFLACSTIGRDDVGFSNANFSFLRVPWGYAVITVSPSRPSDIETLGFHTINCPTVTNRRRRRLSPPTAAALVPATKSDKKKQAIRGRH
ncbi:hypothetical protein GE09DRAFT_228055 [Coniochaeta sp. 2T2.1]|nr:hypothetical protein GE09DRAFT_228055 [Coniochaeta sp. 2T2.1]